MTLSLVLRAMPCHIDLCGFHPLLLLLLLFILF